LEFIFQNGGVIKKMTKIHNNRIMDETTYRIIIFVFSVNNTKIKVHKRGGDDTSWPRRKIHTTF